MGKGAPAPRNLNPSSPSPPAVPGEGGETAPGRIPGPGRGPVSWPAPSQPLPQFLLRPGRAILVCGESIRSLAAGAAAWAVARGMRVLVVDAANVFDPYCLVREARLRGLGRAAVLTRVQVARAFTSHQLVRLLQEELAPRVQPRDLILLLGPVTLFYDEQVPLPERRRLFQGLVEVLAALKLRHPLLLLQPPRPSGAENRHFGSRLLPVIDLFLAEPPKVRALAVRRRGDL